MYNSKARAILVNTLMGHISSEMGYIFCRRLYSALQKLTEVVKKNSENTCDGHRIRNGICDVLLMVIVVSGTVSELRRDLRKNLHGDHG